MREPSKWVAAAPVKDLADGSSSPGEAVGAQSELQWSGGHPVLPVEGAFLHPAGGWVVGPGL